MTKKKKIFYAILIIILVIVIVGILKPKSTVNNSPYIPSENPIPKGDRILGIQVNTAEDNNYDKAFNIAKSAGIQSVALSLNWKDIEISPGEYKLEPNFLAIANQYYPPQKVKIDLIIRSIDTNGSQVPNYLKNIPFDNPIVAEKFNKLMDYVFSQIPDVDLNFLAIGNEIDLGIGKNEEIYKQYETFYRVVKGYIKTKKPNLKVSVVSTLYGLTKNVPEQLKNINQNSDIIIVTYYPLNDDFTVKDPAVMDLEISKLIKIYSSKTIYFSEIGYPSSSVLKSSESKQRDFIVEVFKIWDKYISSIKYISFLWLTDRPSSEIEGFTVYYGLSSKNFKEYLKTLGLRTNKGEDKEAFIVLKAEAKARGW